MEQGHQFHRTLLTLIALRAALVSVLLGSAVVKVGIEGGPPFDPLFMLVALSYALTALYAFTLRYVDERPWLVELQLACDVGLVGAIIFFTGGVASSFTSLFVFPVVAGSVVRFRRGGLRLAFWSASSLAAMGIGQYLQWLPVGWHGVTTLPAPGAAVTAVVFTFLGLLAVALLTGHLAERLSAVDEHLARTSTELADLQATSQHIIDSMTGGLVTSDEAGMAVTFNRAAAAITGLDAASSIGRPVAEVLQFTPDVASRYAALLAGEPASRVDYLYRGADGREIDIGLSMAPLVREGRQLGAVMTFQDLTETRRLDRQRHTDKRLAAIGEMAAGIAHEIRNPLASMSGSIQLLRGDLALNDEQAQLMDIVLRESERLNETIENFLAYAKPKPRVRTRIDVARLIEETAMLLRNSPECAASHIVRVRTPGEPVWCMANEAQVRQIVWNLASNGLRAMADGGTLELSAHDTVDRGAPCACLRVRDEGRGIAEADIENIFHPFRSTFDEGTGLGLAVVHRIVSDVGGRVAVESAPGAGASFTVWLPSEDAMRSGGQQAA